MFVFNFYLIYNILSNVYIFGLVIKMVRKIKKIFLFSTSLIIPTISLPTIFVNGNINDSLPINVKGSDTLSESQVTNPSIDSLKYPFSNDSNNNITPYGIVNVINSDNKKKITMYDYNSNLLWEYDLTNNALLKVIYSAYNIKSIHVKYNSFIDTIFVYGSVTNSSNASKSFLFQIYAQTGKPYLINNTNSSSILSDSNGLTSNIDSLIFDKGESAFIAFDSNQNYATFNGIMKFSYTNYSSLKVNSSDIKNFIQNNQQDATRTITNNKLIKAINLSNGFFGIYKYYEETEQSASVTKTGTVTNKKIVFAIFDWQLKKLTNDLEIYTENNSTQNIVSISSVNLIDIINDSFVILNSDNTYTITLNLVEPILSSSNYNETQNNFGFSNKLRFINFTYPSSNTLASLTLNEIDNTSNYISSLKMDYNTNKIFGITYSNPSKLLSPKLFSFDLSTKKAIEVSNFNNGNTSNNSTLVNIFPIHSSLSYDKQKSFLIKQIVDFNSDNNTLITTTSSIASLNYYSSDVTSSGETFTENNQKQLYESSINNVQEELSNSEFIKKLPSDISESDVLSLIKLEVNGNQNSDLLQSITLLAVEGTNNKLVANNTNGTLKINIEVKVKNWWNPTSSFSTLTKEIELTGFSTISKLEFKLITKETDDQTKWNAIQEYKNSLPSSITQQNIIDSFIYKGENLKIDAENVKIFNSDASSQEESALPQTYISVYPDDSRGTLKITYNLNDISSPSVGQSNLTGSFTYEGFVKTSGWSQVSINNDIFKQFKNQLPYQITKEEIISSLNIGSSYKTSPEYWILLFNDDVNSEQYINNMFNGTINFTLKYNKELDGSVPTSVTDEMLSVSVTSENEIGQGFIKLSDYIGENLYLDTNLADIKTSSLKLNEVMANLSSILDQTIVVPNGWIDPSKIYDVSKKEESPNSVTYNLNVKNEFPSNIQVLDANGNKQNITIDSKWLNKINEVKPNYFMGVHEIKYNIDLTDYDWNYDSISKDDSTISLQNLFEESNASQKGYNYRFQLPSDFVNSFESDPLKGQISFQNTFELIKPYSTNIVNNYVLNSYASSKITDPGYYEIDKVTLIPNDQLGIVIANYVIRYPNLQTAYGNPVLLYPTIKITGMKTQSTSSIDNATIITSILVVLVIVSIGFLIILRVKRNKFVGNNLKTKKDDYFKNKIISNDNNLNKDVNKQEVIKDSKISKKINKDKPKEIEKKNVNQRIDFSKYE